MTLTDEEFEPPLFRLSLMIQTLDVRPQPTAIHEMCFREAFSSVTQYASRAPLTSADAPI
jgi:hypothetical protein